MNTENKKIARDIILLARELLANKEYRYIYDPEHKKKPGPGFKWTPRGWSEKGEKQNEKEQSGNGEESSSHSKGNQFKRSYRPTNEFRRIQSVCSRMSAADTAQYHSDRKKIDERVRERLSLRIQEQLRSTNGSDPDRIQSFVNPKTQEKVKVHQKVPGELFHDIFEICHKFLPKGDCVDIHSAEDYKDNENFIWEDGLAGISITPEGDLVSVFSLSGKRGFLDTIAPIVKKKCRTLDCFKISKSEYGLPELYSDKFGFKTTSILDFNYELMAHDKGKKYANHFVETYGESPVHFMVNTDQEVEIKHFNKDQWEDAYNYQQSIAFPEKKKSRMISSRRRIPWNIPLYVLYKRG